jgi:photosynthetic reaction center cytochrome c subunit
MNLRTTIALMGAGAALLLAGCERPPMDPVQRGYRGTAMEVVYNPRTVEKKIEANQVPAYPPQAAAEGPKAKDIYQNVQVLGDLSVGQFARHMIAITSWVSPKEGCNYCHVGENFADDSKYTKVVARRMIQMTQHINVDWKNHVADTGVTCYTCHRGQPVPAQAWYRPLQQDKRGDMIGNLNGQNQAARSVGLSSLPYDPFTPYLEKATEIRVHGPKPLPTDHVASIQATEGTYALMVHMSSALGVNCVYCHNSRHFASWEGSPPQRVTAWHGIRMARDVNNEYITPLTDKFPATRLGPSGDIGKVNCATCHQGAYKPLFGAPMAKDFPELQVYAGSKSAQADSMESIVRQAMTSGTGSMAAPLPGGSVQALAASMTAATGTVVAKGAPTAPR